MAITLEGYLVRESDFALDISDGDLAELGVTEDDIEQYGGQWFLGVVRDAWGADALEDEAHTSHVISVDAVGVTSSERGVIA